MRAITGAVLLLLASALSGCADSWHCSDVTGEPRWGRSSDDSHRCSEDEMRRAGYRIECETELVDRWSGTEENCYWTQ
jgi:hypothetical protein